MSFNQTAASEPGSGLSLAGTYVQTEAGQVTEECASTCAPGAPADCEDSGCECPHHKTTN